MKSSKFVGQLPPGLHIEKGAEKVKINNKTNSSITVINKGILIDLINKFIFLLYQRSKCYTTKYMSKKRQDLDVLNQYWQENCTCKLRKTAKRAVFGDGNADAEIVFIGEAPGKKEDDGGRPFIGAAGKFLDEMLDGIKMKRESIYITNIVKYRPPNNRDPEQSEKEDCNEWLIKELKIISPKLIVFLGRHSMFRFFPKEKIGDVHGKLFMIETSEFGIQAFMPLYHPAAALYNGGMRETLINDFKNIPKALKKIKKI